MILKKGDFALIYSSKDQAQYPYCIIYVEYRGFDGEYYIHGTIVKSNLKHYLFSDYRYYCNNNKDVIKKINNKSEIEELSFIYKFYLLNNS